MTDRDTNPNLDDLWLATRTRNCLAGAGFRTAGDVLAMRECDLMRTPGFGRKALNEVNEVFDSLGLGRVKKTSGKPRVGDGTPGPGRPKGTPNKTTALLKDAILAAAAKAGGDDGLEGYLAEQAQKNPQSFLPLLGKVLPMQVTGEDGAALQIVINKPGG
jgi:hypothetical protein